MRNSTVYKKHGEWANNKSNEKEWSDEVYSNKLHIISIITCCNPTINNYYSNMSCISQEYKLYKRKGNLIYRQLDF